MLNTMYQLRVELGLMNMAESVRMTLVNPYFISTGMFAGIKSSQIPIQTPDNVADNIVRGILTNQGWLEEFLDQFDAKQLFWTFAVLNVRLKQNPGGRGALRTCLEKLRLKSCRILFKSRLRETTFLISECFLSL